MSVDQFKVDQNLSHFKTGTFMRFDFFLTQLVFETLLRKPGESFPLGGLHASKITNN